jgi:hypothetical protein
MKLNINNAPEEYKPHIVEVGNLYMNMFGDYWLVVSLTPTDGCFILRYDQHGEILGATRYGCHHVVIKKFVGRVELPTLDVLWEGKSI